MVATETVIAASAADAAKPKHQARRGTSAAQPVLRPWIRAQALNLARHTLGIRDFTRGEFGDTAAAPTDGHIIAVNQLLTELRKGLRKQARTMNRLAAAARLQPSKERLTAMVNHKHRAHDWVRRLEKIWDFYLELFGQRQQSPYGAWLLSADRIALDCYQVAYLGLGRQKSVPAPPPFSYMRTGFGPATYRRGLKLRQLGRSMNPFPLI